MNDVSIRLPESEGEVLFNGMTELHEPTWSRYAHLVVGACKDNGGSTESGLPVAQAEFFSIYGRFNTGDVDWITDVYGTPTELLQVAGVLARRSKLPVLLDPSL